MADVVSEAMLARLTKYAAALRCKWPRVSSWTCVDCGFAGSSLRDSWVISAQYDDASDAFINHGLLPVWVQIAEDSTLNAVVVMFRSTYGNEAGWLNNLIGYGSDRTIRGGAYSLHSVNTRRYDGVREGTLSLGLRKCGVAVQLIFAWRTAKQDARHSRGGAMAVLAAVDLATDKAGEVGISNPWVQIKLYTFGQPRVGDVAYANLVESLFAERFRIVANSDPVPHVPPSALEVVDPNSLLSKLDANVQSIKSSLASWVAAELSMDKLSFDTQTIQNDNYRHHGPNILIMDFVLNGNRVYEEVVCSSSDDDSTCNNKQASANQNSGSVGRRDVLPYNYDSTFGAPMNKWPLRAFLDHSYYLEADIGNEKCMGMKPPGWWGWKVTVRTADVLFAGTDSDVFASWSCGATAVTTGAQFLDCSVSLGEVLSGELSDVNCFERNDRDMFKFEFDEGTNSDGNTIIPASSGLETCKATLRPMLTLRSSGTGIASDWDLGGAVLEMAYTSGPADTIITKTWGDCSPSLFGSPLTFSGKDATKSISLCTSSAWWKWKLTLGTATNVGAGTDSTIKASWKHGATAGPCHATRAAPLHDSPACSLGGLSNVNDFTFEFDPGNWGAQGYLLPGNNPQPTCTGGNKPVLTLEFTIKSTTIEWTMDGSKMRLELWYIPSDVTSFWDETTGNQLSRIKYLSFSPCSSPGNVSVQWSSSQSRQYNLC
ncbi:hypothetical protein ABPG77_008319 [Micractinium sp. CCAP 211/92]